jgi:uncharacterized radical SAM superfamily Fe-S cluster-containing enzyme
MVFSICPKCYKKIKAKIMVKGDKIFILKTCPIHGKFIEEHVWDDFKTYRFMSLNSLLFPNDIKPHGLIIDITSKCNLSCSFCFRKNYPEENFSSLLMKIKRINQKMHFSTIFLFGGEPTLRKDLFSLIRELKKMKVEVSLFTNGIKLINHNYVKKLKTAGLDHVTLSFDSLDDSVYEKIRNAKLLRVKLYALKNLKKHKILTSLFVVVTNVNTFHDIVKIITLKLKFPNLHTIYLSTLTREGIFPKDIFPLSSSERINILTTYFRIKREEIYACTTFERLIIEFLYKFFKSDIKYSSPFCDLVCYFYVTKNHVIPLTKVINLESINKELEKAIQKRSHFFKTLKIWCRVFNSFVFKSIFLRVCFSFFRILIMSRMGLKINIPPYFLRVIITRFQDRYNLDLRSFKTCNLYSLCANGEIKPFCERLIWNL